MTVTVGLLFPPPTFAPRAQAAEEPAQSPSDALAGPTQPDAKLRYDQGLTLFAQKQYAAAIAAFDMGFAKEPHRAFLFAKAQAQRLAGDCVRAIVTYDAFLATAPPPLQADATHLAIERCARSATLAPVAPPHSLTLPGPVPAWRRPPALALWTAAGIAFGASAWLYVSSRGARDDAGQAQSKEYSAYAAAWRKGNARIHESELALLAGLLLTAGGVTYTSMAGPWSSPEDRAVAFWLTPHAGGLGFHARF